MPLSISLMGPAESLSAPIAQPAQTNSFTGVEEFPSEPISGARENIGNTIGNLAEQFGLIPDDDVHGNGPSPFVGRPTMDVNNPYNPPLTHRRG